MIKIIDDIVPKEMQDHIETFFLRDIPWFYHPDISGYNGKEFKDKNFFPSGGFYHLAAYDGIINSEFYKENFNLADLVSKLAGAFEVEIQELIRIKLNLTTPVYGYRPNNFCSPHIDTPKPHHVMLYYANDSDGDTVFFETPTDLENEEYKITRRVTPKKGRCVLFDGSMYHTQSNPIKNSVRMNMNINVVLKS